MTPLSHDNYHQEGQIMCFLRGTVYQLSVSFQTAALVTLGGQSYPPPSIRMGGLGGRSRNWLSGLQKEGQGARHRNGQTRWENFEKGSHARHQGVMGCLRRHVAVLRLCLTTRPVRHSLCSYSGSTLEICRPRQNGFEFMLSDPTVKQINHLHHPVSSHY